MITLSEETPANNLAVIPQRRLIRVDFTGVPSATKYARIPMELKMYAQWVCWKFSEGKKLPVTPWTGELANTADPDTWSSFSNAVWHSETDSVDGVGFVWCSDDPYVAIDLDKCRDATTGAIEPWARAIIKEMGSYAEVSQSGTGIHVIVKGRMNGERHKVGRVEIYQDRRYFIMTGNVLPGFTTIRARDLSSLERRMAEGALESKPDHNPPGKDSSASGADYRLIARIAETTGARKAGELEAAVRRHHRQHFK